MGTTLTTGGLLSTTSPGIVTDGLISTLSQVTLFTAKPCIRMKILPAPLGKNNHKPIPIATVQKNKLPSSLINTLLSPNVLLKSLEVPESKITFEEC